MRTGPPIPIRRFVAKRPVSPSLSVHLCRCVTNDHRAVTPSSMR